MEELENKRKNKPTFYIMSLFVIFGTIVSILTLTIGSTYAIPAILNIVIYVAIAIYGCITYKIPHGNHLKYILLLFAFSLLIFTLQSATRFIFALMMGTNGLLVAYMAGRLQKLKTNKRLIWAIIIIFAVAVIVTETNAEFRGTITVLSDPFQKFVYQMLPFNKLIQFVPMAYSYVYRYELHIAAGKKADEEIKTK